MSGLGKADGYWLTSLLKTQLAEIGTRDLLVHVRQRIGRHFVDLTIRAVA